jgi:hypothetical protein
MFVFALYTLHFYTLHFYTLLFWSWKSTYGFDQMQLVFNFFFINCGLGLDSYTFPDIPKFAFCTEVLVRGRVLSHMPGRCCEEISQQNRYLARDFITRWGGEQLQKGHFIASWKLYTWVCGRLRVLEQRWNKGKSLKAAHNVIALIPPKSHRLTWLRQ